MGGSEVLSALREELRGRGFRIEEVSGDVFEAITELEPVGIKRRIVYVLATALDYLSEDKAKELNKLFNKRRPAALRTFFFYNIIIVTERGYSPEALHYIRRKMIEAWNVRPRFLWDILFTSYTKVTHVIDLSRGVVVYPYDYEDLKPLIHRVVREVMEGLFKGG